LLSSARARSLTAGLRTRRTIASSPAQRHAMPLCHAVDRRLRNTKL
jgi:hypothetical protein